MRQLSSELLISPSLRCGENQEFETDALRALLNCRINTYGGMMKKTTIPSISHSRAGDFFYILAGSLLLITVLSGCTVNRVSMLTRQPTGNPVAASEVQLYSTFKDISEPWELEGMISVYTLPIMNNDAEKREALIKNTVAVAGINAVVGLQSLTGDGHVGLSNGILAKQGSARQKDAQVIPKFIVFLPSVNFKIEKEASMNKLDDYLREHIQYFLSYTKGYYVHRYDHPGISNAGVLQGNIDPAALVVPLGVAPDFVLLCDVDGYDESGNIVTHSAKTLKITLTLFDLKQKRVFWTSAGSGKTTQSLLRGAIMFGPLFCRANLLTESEERSFIVRRAIMDAMDSLPIVDGFRGGTISPVDRK
jgi:hypothetical protein